MNFSLKLREDALVWVLSFFIFLFVMVQLHVELFDFAININLADFFVMLCSSTAILAFVYERSFVRWKIKRFNIYAVMTLVAIISGWTVAALSEFKITWATSKVIGWVVVLGYLYSSAVLVNRLGFFVFFRFFNLLLVFFVVLLLVADFLLFLHIAKSIRVGDAHAYLLEGLAGNRNALAFQALAVMCMVMAFQPLYKRGAGLGQPFLLLAAVVLAGTIILTTSRSAIATMLILYVFSFLMKIANRKFLILTLAGGAAFAALVFYGAGWFYFVYDLWGFGGGDVGNVALSISSDESDAVRMTLLKNSFAMWVDSPVWGAGLGAFYTSSESIYGFPLVQHNSLLWVLSEMGVFGLLMFLPLFISLIWFAFFSGKRTSRNNAVILLLLALGAMAMFHEMLYQRTFWLFLGAVIAVGLPGRGASYVGCNNKQDGCGV